MSKLVLDDGARVRNERPDYVCAERGLAGRRSSRKGCLNTLLQPHGKIQIGPRPIAVFQHGHSEDQLVNILKVFVAPALHGLIRPDRLRLDRNIHLVTQTQHNARDLYVGKAHVVGSSRHHL